MRLAAVLNGTIGSTERQARALGAFLREGVLGDLAAETVLFYEDEGDRDRLVALSPTRDVRLIRTTARRPEPMARLLAAVADDEGWPCSSLPAGSRHPKWPRAWPAAPTAPSSRTRSPSRRSRHADLPEERLLETPGGRLSSTAGPWCVTVDACWNETQAPIVSEHHILADTDGTGEAGTTPFDDVELVEPPSTTISPPAGS